MGYQVHIKRFDGDKIEEKEWIEAIKPFSNLRIKNGSLEVFSSETNLSELLLHFETNYESANSNFSTYNDYHELINAIVENLNAIIYGDQFEVLYVGGIGRLVNLSTGTSFIRIDIDEVLKLCEKHKTSFKETVKLAWDEQLFLNDFFNLNTRKKKWWEFWK